MPNVDVASPVSSAPTDRLALGVGCVRTGAGSIGGSPDPSAIGSVSYVTCFEGNEK